MVMGWSVMCGFERGLGARFAEVSGAGDAIAGGIEGNRGKNEGRQQNRWKIGVVVGVGEVKR